MWAKPGKQVCSGIHGRFLTDELHLDGAVHVVQESIIIKVSAVFVSVTETGPVVRLPGFPPSGKNTHTLLIMFVSKFYAEVSIIVLFSSPGLQQLLSKLAWLISALKAVLTLSKATQKMLLLLTC